MIQWNEAGQARSARWRSESGAPPPARVEVIDDRTTADAAYGLACQGVGLLWRGDFQNARQMLVALASRADRHPRKKGAHKPLTFPEAFHTHRQAQAQRARTLSRLLLPFDPDYSIPLGRAPDVREACVDAYGPGDVASVASLRDLQGMVGAHEWRRKGIDIPEAGGAIHPHYGIFAPVRREYIGLVANAPLPEAVKTGVAFDVGTGTGVLAAVLAKRGVGRVVATDLDPRAIACARENIARLGFSSKVEVVEADLFPPGRAALVVCNPPWIPARPSSPVERGIYDFESAMLRAFLRGLPAHLEEGGEGWLILSDLAEHLRLRTREELLALFEAHGLQVADRMDVKPKHPKATDASDPLHAARSAEVTSLWRLTPR